MVDLSVKESNVAVYVAPEGEMDVSHAENRVGQLLPVYTPGGGVAVTGGNPFSSRTMASLRL